MRNTKLIWQIFPSFIIVIVLTILSVSWYYSKSMRDFAEEMTRQDLKIRLELFREEVQPWVEMQDWKLVSQFSRKMAIRMKVRYTLIDPQGVVRGDSDKNPSKMDNHAYRPEFQSSLAGRDGSSIRFSNTLGFNMMYVSLPITHQNQVIGAVRAAVSVASIDHELQNIYNKIIWGGIIAAVLVAGISWRLSRRLVKPLEELKGGVTRFSEGDFKIRFQPKGSVEITSLSNAINTMAELLEERFRTIIRQKNEQDAVLSSMMEGVIAVDMKERILKINQTAMGQFQVRMDDVSELQMHGIIRNTDMHQLIRQVLQTNESREGEIISYHAGEKVLQVHATPLKDAKGIQIGALAVLNDITRLRKLENLRKDFVANVSHELRTPITSIKGFVETLQHQENIDEFQKKQFLEIIAKHTTRLNNIIEDLLALARIEQDHESQSIPFGTDSLNQLLQESIQCCLQDADAKNIVLSLHVSNDLEVEMNFQLMEQAVVNLIENAVKYSENDTEVTVSLVQELSEIKIQVADQGPGIEENELPRLFERFYRVDKARSRKVGGTGLGLAIVKHISQAHGGHVSVDSELGKGSTFTIHLPYNVS